MAVSVVVLLAGCLEPGLIPCGERLCPAGAVCLVERATCAFPDALDACEGLADGALCEAVGIDGACDAGLCVGSTCGDGVVTGREQCDGAAGTATCGDFRFYYGELACSASCLLDTGGCSGTCGDGLVQADVGEACDGSPPPYSCVDIGYDYGHLGCTDLCVDSARSSCDSIRPRRVFSGGDDQIEDVWRDANRLVVSRGRGSLVVVDRGQRVEHPTGIADDDYQTPGYGPIAGDATRLLVARRLSLAAPAEIVRVDGLALAVEPSPGFTTEDGELRELAFAPNGDLWALAESCAVRVQRSGGSAWMAAPSYPGTGCESLAVDQVTDEVYVATTSEVRILDGAGWTRIIGDAVDRVSDSGRDGRAIAVIGGGVVELAGTTVTPTAVDFSTRAAQWVADGSYVLATILPAWSAPNRPTIFVLDHDYMDHIARMADGSVLMWRTSVYELGALFGNIPEPTYVELMLPAPMGFVGWVGDRLIGHTQRTELDLGEDLDDVAPTAGETLYVLGQTKLFSGTLRRGFTETLVANSAHAIWGDEAGNVAILHTDARLELRPVGAAPVWVVAPAGCTSGTSIAGFAFSELYVANFCGPTSRIFAWDGATLAQVYDASGGLGRLAIIGDHVAAGGSSVVFGRGTTWSTLPFAGDVVSGAALDDLYVTTNAVPSGFGHWDGTTFAEVRSEGDEQVRWVAADRGMLVVGADGYRTYARLPLAP